MFREVRRRVPGVDRGIVLSAHCHDDLGLAVANSLAAISAGAGQVECTINGIGERAGNAALEEIVMAGRVRAHRSTPSRPASSRASSTAPARCCPTSPAAFPSRTRRSWAATPSPTRPASTSTACCRTAGPTRSSSPTPSASPGLPWCWAALRPPRAGAPLPGAGLRDRGGAAGQASTRRSCSWPSGSGRSWTRTCWRCCTRASTMRPRSSSCAELRVVCGSGTATADVTLAGPYAGARSATGTGDGPIAAAFAAVERDRGQDRRGGEPQPALRDTRPRQRGPGVPPGAGGGRTFSAHSASTDIVEASARAMVNALNKSRHAESLEAAALDSNSYWGVS